MKKFLFIALLVFLSCIDSQAQPTAFPGAEGFGKFATGGRGGKVYTVTNLNDSGPGSFRDGLNSFPNDPLTIVFAVGGTIDLQSEIRVKRSNLTIAGQTAPGDGICLKGHSFKINGARAISQGGNHGNIIIRYLRSRPGGTADPAIYGFNMENCHNVIVDHCSFSWANEECAAMYDTKNVTVQWSIFSEGLYNSGHLKGNRSYGGVWGGQYSSYHHNLIAHQQARAIRFNGARAHDTLAVIDYRNNVIYNAGSHNAAAGGDIEIPNGESKINLVNNYYKPGPATPGNYSFIQADYNAATSVGVGEFYVSGNVMVNYPGKTADNWTGVDFSKILTQNQVQAKSIAAFPVSQVLPNETAKAAYENVLKNAGAILPKRDAVDTRIVSETATGTVSTVGITSGKGGIIDKPEEVGGWPLYQSGTTVVDTDGDGMPDAWESLNGLDPNDGADGNIINSENITKLEEYLNSILPQVTNNVYQLVGFGATLSTATPTSASINWVLMNDAVLQNIALERSQDGNTYTQINTVVSQQQTGISEYSYTDNNPLEFNSYYRLKFTDTEGVETYNDPINLYNPTAQAYWTEPFTTTTVTTIEKPATVKITVQDNGEWIFYGARRITSNVNDNHPDNQWKDGSTNPTLQILNGNPSTTADYFLTEAPYVITPVFSQGISKITFYETGRNDMGSGSIVIYTSKDGGQTWSTAGIGTATKASKFDLITVIIEGTDINRLKITKPAGVTMNIDNLTIYAPVGTTLPLDLISFTAKTEHALFGSGLLEWKTSNEKNTLGFDIEKSINGKVFEKIGYLNAKNIQGTHLYKFTDEKPLEGVNYYRLKQIDIDGKFTYSEVRSVNIQKQAELSIYPNPVDGYAVLNHPGLRANIVILNSAGKQIIKSSIAPKTNQTRLDLSSLVPGIYILNYRNDQEIKSLKFIKK